MPATPPGPRRVAMLSVHTSPLDPPGSGDAGGMNVYVVELARRLAERGVEVDVFTRATSSEQAPVAELAPGVAVRHVLAGPYETLPKTELPAALCAFTSGVLRAEAARAPGHYDLVHSHYWLSGQVGWLAAERWGVPLVHSMHTMSKVKNQALAAGDLPEPRAREIGEEQVVAASDVVVANTRTEADQLVTLYGAARDRVATVSPGVDLERFTPGPRAAARARLELPADAVVALFAGRLQPLKAPDVVLRAAARLVESDPAMRSRLVIAVVGGQSGTEPLGTSASTELACLATRLGIGDVVRFEPPAGRAELADWFRAADLTAVPSYNESFGLVALESQACGTPVVAASVGGLRTAVADGVSGVLVDGHDPAEWARVLARLIDDHGLRRRLGAGAVTHAAAFGWDETAARMLDVYAGAQARRRADAMREASRLGV